MRRTTKESWGFLLTVGLVLGLGACVGGGQTEPDFSDSGLPSTTDAEPTAERVARILDLPADVDAGELVYEEGGCMGCHGEYGYGTDVGPPLVSTALDLAYVFEVAIDGTGSMPSQAEMSDQDLADLGAYLDDDVLYASDCRSAGSRRCD